MTKSGIFTAVAIIMFGSAMVNGQDSGDTGIKRELIVAGTQISLIEMNSSATLHPDEHVMGAVYRQEQRGNVIFAQDMDVHRCAAVDPSIPGPNSFCFTVPEAGKIRLDNFAHLHEAAFSILQARHAGTVSPWAHRPIS
jgi:hypothetical protein